MKSSIAPTSWWNNWDKIKIAVNIFRPRHQIFQILVNTVLLFFTYTSLWCADSIWIFPEESTRKGKFKNKGRV